MPSSKLRNSEGFSSRLRTIQDSANYLPASLQRYLLSDVHRFQRLSGGVLAGDGCPEYIVTAVENRVTD
jgi:hypothetical protein